MALSLPHGAEAAVGPDPVEEMDESTELVPVKVTSRLRFHWKRDVPDP